MPQLGLGLGLHKGNVPQSAFKQLVAASDWLFDANYATGTSPGLNSPLTNPAIDVAGKVGKNLFDPVKVSKPITQLIAGKQAFVSNGFSESTSVIFRGDFKPNTAYTVSTEYYQTVNTNARIRFEYSDGSVIIGASGSAVGVWTPITATSDPSKTLTGIRLNNGGTTDQTAFNVQTQLELGSVATAYEPYGKANILWTNMAGTTADGYATFTAPNGKTKVAVKGDGVDTYGVLPSNAPNPLGTTELGVMWIFRTAGTLVNSTVKARNNLALTDAQYALSMTSAGALQVHLEGVAVITTANATVAINGNYKVLLTRIGGTLKLFVNGVEVASVANNTSLTTKPNVRQFAHSTNAGGTTHTNYANIFLAHESWKVGGDVAKFATLANKMALSEYGL